MSTLKNSINEGMLDSNKIISNLLSEDKDLIKSTISEIKSEGDMSIVPLLFEVLKNPELNHSAEGAIATLLAEIKDPAFIPMLNEEINNLTADDIVAVVDFSNAEVGTATYKATITFGEEFPNVGALKTSSVSATVQMTEE